MHQASAVSEALLVVNESAESQSRFFRLTYAHLAVSILAFLGVETIFLNTPGIVAMGLAIAGGWWWILALVAFGFAMTYAETLAAQGSSLTVQYAALAFGVVIHAFIFVPLVYVSLSITGDFSLLQSAAMMTLTLFVAVSAAALTSARDLSGMRPWLVVAGVMGFGLIVVGTAFDFSLGFWFPAAMACLAAGAILYQTSRLKFHYTTGQHVAAALGLFGAFMMLLWQILSILNRASSD